MQFFVIKILCDQTVYPDVVLSTYIHDKGFFMRTSINSKGIIDDLKKKPKSLYNTKDYTVHNVILAMISR